MNEDIISVENLRRRYGGEDGFEAVRGVTFSVGRGELFALLGTNGAGKTSALEVLEGLARPAAGTVRVLGHDPWADRALVRPRIGIMLQEGGFPSDLTVLEMARMWAGILSDHRPVREVLDQIGLSGREDVAIRALSGGERRRLDLALAVLGRPEVLFLDEPTTGLDPESRHNTWRLVRGLLMEGTTVLLTTHYLEEAEELADRLAIMHAGRIVTTGTAAEIAAAHPARISFERPDARLRIELPALPGTLRVDQGRRVTVHTETLQDALTHLLGWARTRGVELRGLEAHSGSLEQAFLAAASGGDSETTKEVAA